MTLAKAIAASAALMCALNIAGPAAAGDRGPRSSFKDDQAPFAWSGFYLGVHGGYGWGTTDALYETALNGPGFRPTQSYDIDGGVFGAAIGWNYQAAGSPWLLGLEADLYSASLEGRSDEINDGLDDHWRTKIDWYGTVRGRFGYAWGRSLLYATGGLAYGEVKTDYIDPSNPAGTSNLYLSKTRVGYTVGAGLEHMLLDSWSIRVEYGYINLGHQRLADPTESTRFETDFHVVKGGINYRF